MHSRFFHAVVTAIVIVAPFMTGTAIAQDKCFVRAVIAGQPVELTHCVISVYDHIGATILFSATPISPEERKDFQLSSYAKDREPSGKPRSMMHLMFCPGGGKSVPDAATVKSVEMSMALATNPIAQRQWVFDLPKDSKDFTFKALSGNLQSGGRLIGQATGAKTSDNLQYSWDARFDVAVPDAVAAAGPGCGG